MLYVPFFLNLLNPYNLWNHSYPDFTEEELRLTCVICRENKSYQTRAPAPAGSQAYSPCEPPDLISPVTGSPPPIPLHHLVRNPTFYLFISPSLWILNFSLSTDSSQECFNILSSRPSFENTLFFPLISALFPLLHSLTSPKNCQNLTIFSFFSLTRSSSSSRLTTSFPPLHLSSWGDKQPTFSVLIWVDHSAASDTTGHSSLFETLCS